MKTFWDLVNRDFGPIKIVFTPHGRFFFYCDVLLYSIDKELELTVLSISCDNGVFTEFEFNCAKLVKENWITQVEVDKSVVD